MSFIRIKGKWRTFVVLGLCTLGGMFSCEAGRDILRYAIGGPIYTQFGVECHVNDGRVVTVIGRAESKRKWFKTGPCIVLLDDFALIVTNVSQKLDNPWPAGINDGMLVRVRGKIITVDELSRRFFDDPNYAGLT